MTLTLNLSPEEESHLARAARNEGIDAASFAERLMRSHLALAPEGVEAANISPIPEASRQVDDRTLALLAQWDEEDNAMTPEEVEGAKRDFEEFKMSLNAERRRAGARHVYPP